MRVYERHVTVNMSEMPIPEKGSKAQSLRVPRVERCMRRGRRAAWPHCTHTAGAFSKE